MNLTRQNINTGTDYIRSMNNLWYVIVTVIMACLVYNSLLYAQSQTEIYVELTWNAPTTNEDGSPLTDLGGYRIYYGVTTKGVSERPSEFLYDKNIDVENVLDYIIGPLPIQSTTTTYYFSITAYDTQNNESKFSNEVFITIAKGNSVPPSLIDTIAPSFPTLHNPTIVNSTNFTIFTSQVLTYNPKRHYQSKGEELSTILCS